MRFQANEYRNSCIFLTSITKTPFLIISKPQSYIPTVNLTNLVRLNAWINEAASLSLSLVSGELGIILLG